jgi:hypothetical protein
MADSVPLVGPFDGNLSDTGTTVRLERPIEPSPDDPTTTPWMWVDEVRFGIEPPWPTDLVGTGRSLTRTTPASWGLAPISWTGQLASPGTVQRITRNPGDANDDGRFDQNDLQQVQASDKYLTGQPATWSEGDWNGDGRFDQLDIVKALQADSYLALLDAAWAGW